jgi:hypothetical protein
MHSYQRSGVFLIYFSDRASSYNSGKWPTWRTISSIICLFESSTCFEQLCAHPQEDNCINPLNSEVYPISHLLVLLGDHPILYVSTIRVNTSCGIIILRLWPSGIPELKTRSKWITSLWKWVRHVDRTWWTEEPYCKLLSEFPVSCSIRSGEWLVGYLETLFKSFTDL